MAIALEALISRSIKNMGNVNPRVSEYAVELIRRAYAEGIYVQISSGYRSNADQQKLYNQGRTTPGNVVTNAKPGTSVHNYGFAIDYFLVSDDGNTALWTVNAKWRRVAAIAKSMGFAWGGDWKSFVDYPHLELTKGLSVSQLRAGKRPTINPLVAVKSANTTKPKPEVAGVTFTKGTYRIKTGAFPNARGLADAIDKANADFGWLLYEVADATTFNPTYRIYTGVFNTKESAEDARKQITDKYGWLTYLIDETK